MHKACDTWHLLGLREAAALPRAQVKLVKEGKPYVMFGDGTLASCKPISEPDLAAFMADCVAEPGMVNRVLPIGGARRRRGARRAAARAERRCSVEGWLSSWGGGAEAVSAPATWRPGLGGPQR